ncbi:unnamed protein product, partial [Mesorhabditis belari]|uniref:Uncharacterized protein n=1 Tax=Mesorhabditis belari TaxID=2138241 RepID=A0AAF3EEL7_9BILA
MCCCCCGLHRHQIHLISYACVAGGLIATGLVFTVFSIFYKDSQIGKVWLAGPTTMVVGLVLVGKVMIDWGPAMMSARQGSIDSRMAEQTMNPATQRLANNGAMMMPNGRSFAYSHSSSPDGYQRALIIPNQNTQNHSNGSISVHSGSRSPSSQLPQTTIAAPLKQPVAESCLIYSQYEPPFSNLNATPIGSRLSQAKLEQSPRGSITSPAVSEICECAKYGSIRRPVNLYQGESFVLNDRNYLI